MEIVYLPLNEIVPYEKNPRKNDHAVDAVVASIREFGFKVPIVLDKDNIIVTGHTRLKAAKKLGLDTVPCIYADDLTQEQIRAFRLADNKVGEIAEWDLDLLRAELSELNMDDFGLGDLFIVGGEDEDDGRYTKKINIPQYEPQGFDVDLSQCIEKAKYDELAHEIDISGITQEEKDFLRMAATRHYRFNYKNIAEYYAKASVEMKRLMEQSALVIIDYEDALKNGFVVISEKTQGLIDD